MRTFWRRKAFWLPCRRFVKNTFVAASFRAGCRTVIIAIETVISAVAAIAIISVIGAIIIMLWPCGFAALLPRRELFTVTGWPSLSFLFRLRRYWKLRACYQRCYTGFRVNSEPLQRDYLS